MCTINKSAHTKKSLETYWTTLVLLQCYKNNQIDIITVNIKQNLENQNIRFISRCQKNVKQSMKRKWKWKIKNEKEKRKTKRKKKKENEK